MARKPGTPNNITRNVREILSKVMDEYFTTEAFVTDLAKLEPKDRVSAMEKFASYVVPKLQTTTLDVTMQSQQTIEDKLKQLAEENEQ